MKLLLHILFELLHVQSISVQIPNDENQDLYSGFLLCLLTTEDSLLKF